MQQVSFLFPSELAKDVEQLCHNMNITQDEIVRRAVHEYVARENAKLEPSSVPHDIRTRLVSPRDSRG